MRLSLRFFSKAMATPVKRTFLFWLSNEHTNFGIPELESLFKLFKLDETALINRRVRGPFVLMDFQNEDDPKKLLSRSVLTHSCYEIWGEGSSKEELNEDIKRNFDMITPFSKSSFQVRVETYGKTMSQLDKLSLIDVFSYLPLQGKVDLKNSECNLTLILYYGIDPNNTPDLPYHWCFGRYIGDGQRKMTSKMSLKTRKFIGNTSMDPVLALLMINFARIEPCHMVLDPFVGTGGILVAAASMGGHVIGSDIDFLMLHGRTKSTRAFQIKRTEGENIRANFVQYGLDNQYLDIVIADASRPFWREEIRFDAIITDPPYGIRESTERLGSSKQHEAGFKIKEEYLSRHYPAKMEYSLTDIFCDLMNFAVEKLEVGGRLVYWIPISRPDYDEEKLPKNPCLVLVHNIEQILSSFASRRLLVFEKTKESSSSNLTIMDETALMYRINFFKTSDRDKKVRKSEAESAFGKATKRGQLLPPTLPLEDKMTISNK